jgi:hypothetical protein
MNRKSFFGHLGRACVGSCLCAAGVREALGQTSPDTSPGAGTPARAVKRTEYSDAWVRRFMDVLDQTLDSTTRTKVMMTNGKTCFSDWIRSQGREIRPVSFETWAARHREPSPNGFVRVEGNVIYFEYSGSAETGQASPEGICLCPMVESNPKGLSRTYCLCSVGYVKEMHERTFGRSCEVELLDSVLYGGRRAPRRRAPPSSSTRTGAADQMSAAYSRTVRSLEKRPIPATLRMDIRAQSWARW